jgi:BlaI family transcriptional regulator, penicillinase repressor
MKNSLTNSEEELMLKLWELDNASVKELLVFYTDPKPAYNTVSTIIRILEKKGIVKHKKKGRGYRYEPVLSKQAYRKQLLKHLTINYYNNDYQMISSETNSLRTLKHLL